MICRRYRVYGKVQGVWFRDSTRKKAESLGIQGSATNLPDGCVEVIACGGESAINQLYQWLHKGPILAKVSAVDCLDYEGHCPAGFSVA